MTQEEKAKAYDNALEIAKGLYAKDAPDSLHLERMFPQLKESEDENIRKAIHIYFDWLDGRKDYQPKGEYTIRDMIAWLEKQGEQKQETSYPKFDFDDILAIQCCMETAEKVTEDKELYEKLKSLHSRLHDVYWLEKQREQDPYNGVSFKCNGHTWGMCARDNGVDILLDRQLIKHLEKQGKQEEPQVYDTEDGIITDFETNGYKLVPNFKVRYAGREYDVLKVKDVSGVRFYGIEDEPNHIDYVKAENCERVDGYSMKENGSAYPTKSAVFSEQPTTDKIEPKFHEGDWLCENAPNNYARFIQILEIVNVQGKERYRISRDIHNDEDVVECRFIENNYHSFTIADAKAGDVLVYKENIKGSNRIKYERICLFNNFDNAFFILTTVSNDVEGYDIDVNINYPDDTIPAIKEQREQLKKAMTDAGYAFNFDKKELKKIVVPKFKIGDTMRTLQEASNGITSGLPVIISIDNEYYHCNNELIAIKNQDNYEYPPMNRRQKPAWSEEDENLLNISVENLTELKDRFGKNYGRVGDCINWLKSLKDRCTWKPSDEQLDALQYVYRKFNPPLTDKLGWDSLKTLELLYQDLKKLK